MRLGEKVKIKLADGTKMRGVIVGWQRDSDTAEALREMVPGPTLTTLQIVLESEEIIR